jgi:hypothetical protein
MTADAKITPEEAKQIARYLAAVSARDRAVSSTGTGSAGGK